MPTLQGWSFASLRYALRGINLLVPVLPGLRAWSFCFLLKDMPYGALIFSFLYNLTGLCFHLTIQSKHYDDEELMRLCRYKYDFCQIRDNPLFISPYAGDILKPHTLNVYS